MTFPRVTAAGDAIPTDREVSIDVEVIEQFSDSRPASLRIRLTNDAPTTRWLVFGFVVPFGPLVGTNLNESGELHVIPRDDGVGRASMYGSTVPDERVDGCWKLTGTYHILDSGTLWEADPGASVACTYAVLDDSGPDVCLPSGDYRFEAEWGEDRRSDADEKQNDSRYPWGFTLELVPR